MRATDWNPGHRAVRGRLFAGLSTVAMSLFSNAETHAQEAEAAATEEKAEEIVVTARRVEENVQKVPLAVTAISGEMVKERGIVQVTDVMFAAPSVQVTTSFGRLTGAFAIRGLAGGTQTYFAEVVGGPTESGAPFYDIGSVQVLNGPQGTLFGRANTAGAVLVEPAKPRFNRFTGMAEVAAGNLGLVRGTAVLNVPAITDMLALRAAVHIDHLDGFVKELGTGRRLSENNSQQGRVSANFKTPDGRFTNYAVLDYYNVDQRSSGVTLAAINTNLALFNLPANINAPNGLTVGTQRFGTVCNQAVAAGLSTSVAACIDQRLQIAATLKPALIAELNRLQAGGHDAIRSTPGNPLLDHSETLKKWTFVNQTAYDFGDIGFTTLTLRNIFGFQQAKGVTGWDVDGVGGVIQASGSVISTAPYAYSLSIQQAGSSAILGTGPYQKIYSNETSARGSIGDDFIAWSLGGYYQVNPIPRNLEGIRNVQRTNSGITLATLGYAPTFAFSAGGRVTQKAVYGQATVDLGSLTPFLSALHATGGLRKSWDRSRLETIAVTTSLPSGMYVPTAGAPTLQSETKSSGYNSTLSLDAEITDDLLVYVATRKGYRPGGVNVVLNSTGLPNFSPTFAPESVRDYELGVKWSVALGDARVRLNAAAYRTNYTNIQRTFTAAVGGATTTYIVNAAAAKIEGIELQGMIAWGNWDLSLNYAYANPRFTDWVGADPLGLITPGSARCVAPSTATLCLIDLSSSPFPNISKHQGSATLKYIVPIASEAGEVSLQGTLYSQSRRYFTDAAQRNLEVFGPGVLDAVSQEGFERANLRADWKHVLGSAFSVAAFVNNLTDTNYKLAAITQLHSLGFASVIYAEPRTFGLEVRYELSR